MDTKTQAFFDEMRKIAAEQPFVTRERVLRALKAGLAASGGMGLGWGIGNLAADTILPRALNRFLPHPTASQLQKGMLVAGGIGMLGTLATDLMRHRARQYIAEGDKKPQDMLMGHEKLNPEPYEAAQ